MLIGSQVHVIGLYAPSYPRVCTMTLFADYVKFCAKVEGQGVILTFDTHVASFTHLVDCKYKINVHRQ